MFKNIGLVAKPHDSRATNCIKALIAYLRHHQLHIFLESSLASEVAGTDLNTVAYQETLGKQCDLVIAVGGDGTMLQIARILAEYDARLLGINLGRLGFLTDISPSGMEKQLELILEGQFSEEKRFFIQASVYREDICLTNMYALNESVIRRWDTSHLLVFETIIDGHFVSRQRSDGLVIATPTGSTAYSLSAGGPIVHPSLNALILVSICPHALNHRPLVVSGNSQIQVTVDVDQAGQAQLSCDGVFCQHLVPGDQVFIQQKQFIQLVHPKNHNHYATLRTKLDWGKSVVA